jgi:hypothetical protein
MQSICLPLTQIQTSNILRHEETAASCLWYDLSDSSLLKMIDIAYFHSIYFYFQISQQVKSKAVRSMNRGRGGEAFRLSPPSSQCSGI